MSIYWRLVKADSRLDGNDSGSDLADVDNTGVLGDRVALSGTVGVLVIVDMTFVDPATDNGEVEIHESDDDVTYTKNATYDTTVTKDAGETVRAVINVTTATQFLKVKAASAGATDTIITRVQYQKKSNEKLG
jgi:hypothetical protein